jgi:hypothetical protein
VERPPHFASAFALTSEPALKQPKAPNNRAAKDRITSTVLRFNQPQPATPEPAQA